jgi:hypothetical protein
MPYSLTLPDGTVVNNIPDNVTRAQALENLKVKVPDAFPAPPGIGEQLLGLPAEIGKGFIRGLTVDPLSGATSLGYTGARAAGADLAPFEQTGVGKGSGKSSEAHWLQAMKVSLPSLVAVLVLLHLSSLAVFSRAVSVLLPN